MQALQRTLQRTLGQARMQDAEQDAGRWTECWFLEESRRLDAAQNKGATQPNGRHAGAEDAGGWTGRKTLGKTLERRLDI